MRHAAVAYLVPQPWHPAVDELRDDDAAIFDGVSVSIGVTWVTRRFSTQTGRWARSLTPE
jgi:hypothetical protein